ncbi:hypothetical protein JCM8097_007636 [Rhodosporidiobolus ruineniae]
MPIPRPQSPTKDVNGTRRGSILKRRGRSASHDAEEVQASTSRRRKDRWSKPTVRLAFPASPSPSEDETMPFPGSLDGEVQTIGRSEGRRVISQTQTTTIRTTERRRVRCSLPLFDEYFEDDPLFTNNPRPASPVPVPTRSSRTGRSHSPSGSASSSGSGGKRRSSSSASRSPKQSRRSARDASPMSWPRHSPGQPRGPVGHPSTSPYFARSAGGGAGLVSYRRGAHGEPEPVFPFSDALTDTAALVQPLFSTLALVAVSAVAALTVTAVLLTSLGLTFYDDCTQRLGSVQRRLTGVRAGVQRLIGNTKEALDLAVRATAGPWDGSSRPGSPDSPMSSSPKRRRTATPPTEGEEEDPQQENQGQAAGQARRPRSRKSSTASNSSAGSSSSLGRAFAPFLAPLRPFTSTPSSPVTEKQPPSWDGEQDGGWKTDEDLPPYEVPCSSPSGSGTTSPSSGRAPRSRQSSGEATSSFPSPPFSTASPPSPASSPPSRPTLPPRPHLAILVPSLIFALLFTIAKVVARACKGKLSGAASRSMPAR